MSKEHVVLSSGGIMIIILLTLFGNFLVCFAVYYSRNLRARVNYLIVSLAVADIMIASISMPLWMTLEITGFAHLSDDTIGKLISFWTFVDVLGGIASISNLVAISYERLWSVYSPLMHRRYLTKITAAIIIGFVWIYAALAAGTTVQWQHWEYVTIYSASVGFFFPLMLIFTAYIGIAVIVNRSPRHVVSAQDNSRINRTICIIVLLFIICWAPHFIISILIHQCESCSDFFLNKFWIRSLSTWLHYVNSCLNPLVYGIANAQFKDAFKAVFRKLCFPCYFKTFPKQNGENQVLNYPIASPQRKTSETSKALFVELTPEEKELDGARGGFYSHDRSDDQYDDQYLPGDYRALPIVPMKEIEWNIAECAGENPADDSEALRKALLDPQSLSRTSYI